MVPKITDTNLSSENWWRRYKTPPLATNNNLYICLPSHPRSRSDASPLGTGSFGAVNQTQSMYILTTSCRMKVELVRCVDFWRWELSSKWMLFYIVVHVIREHNTRKPFGDYLFQHSCWFMWVHSLVYPASDLPACNSYPDSESVITLISFHQWVLYPFTSTLIGRT